MNQRRNLQTGQYIAGCRTHSRYIRVECEESLLRVFVGVPTMTQAELDRFRADDIQFTAAVLDECLFFLFRFGDAPWVTAPFAPNGYGALPDRMTFVFVDSDSGVAQEIRPASLSPDVADWMYRKCEAMSAFSYDRTERLKRQSAVLRRHPTGEDLLQASDSSPVFSLQ